MRTVHALVALILVVAGACACDRTVLVDAELQSMDRFESIGAGTTAQAVVEALGAPTGSVRSGPAGLTFGPGGVNGAARSTLSADRANWPPELNFLPDRPVDATVLVYVEGTVIAYYFVDRDGRVAHVDVHVS